MQYPKVSINMAVSLDGKISTHAYTPARFTSGRDSKRLLELRAGADALLVGRGTLEADNMRMTVPDELLQGGQGPLRCVVSRKGEWNGQHPIFSVSEPAIILYHTECLTNEVSGVEHKTVAGVDGLLSDLSQRGVKHVHCEGGGELLRELFAKDLVDELFITWAASKLFGGMGAPTLAGEIGEFLEKSRHFELISMGSGEDGEAYIHYSRIK